MIRKFGEIETWGTVIVLEAFSDSHVKLDKSFEECEKFLQKVDEIFSTFRADSQISKLRKGEIKLPECDAGLQEIWFTSEKLKSQTNGAFDPWSVKGGVDFSGIVKGWAADKCCQILKSHQIDNCLINAAGDISVRGARHIDGELKPWRIGIRDPRDLQNQNQILKEFELEDCAIATSGTYERAHIFDPYTNLIAIGSLSATVVGPVGAVCEALATALIVVGEPGIAWFKQPQFLEYFAWVIDREGKFAYSTKESDLNI